MMRTSRCPFTAAQWQELEQQVLIFRYLASGNPVPFELILPIRSLLLHSTNSTSYPTVAFLPPQPTIGWGCFHKDFGRKAEDPEPGRCRRTDGKKWRCSREAYPDSKYCERHMHRGKNRSRKLVEISATTTIPTTFSSHPYCPYPPPFSLHSHPSPSANSPGIGLPLHYNNTYFHLDIASHSSTEKAHRQYHGMADAVYEKNELSEICEADRGSCRQFREMLSLDELKQRPPIQPRTCSNPCKELLREEEKHRHCFVLGADFMSGEAVKVTREEEGQKPRLLPCFFDDGRLQNKDSLDPEDQLNPASYTMTQLSISIPMTHHDFF